MNEQRLIARIARGVPSRVPRGRREVAVGLGDDAAVLRVRSRAQLVLSCDAFLEGVHFRRRTHPPDAIGYKALVRAASDLAAMGATPRFFLLSLALPARLTGAWLDAFLQGLARAARRLHMQLIGGDTSRHAAVAINITVLGSVSPRGAILRSGARPGDQVVVSGTLGRAQLGLELLLRPPAQRVRWSSLLRPHLAPEPRLRLGRWLARHRIASAMIDVSDGLSTDLAHICEASGVGAVLREERIPRPVVPAELLRRGCDPLAMALHGGEDYELLFTVPRARQNRLRARVEGVALTAIGEVTRRKGVWIERRGERPRPLLPMGWDPFRR